MTYESPTRHWWDTHDNIVLLAYWMRERDHGVDDFVSLIEKPWKWTTEYEQAVADFAAEDAEATRSSHTLNGVTTYGETVTEDVLADTAKRTVEWLKREQERALHGGFFDEGPPEQPEGFIKPVLPPRADNERPT